MKDDLLSRGLIHHNPTPIWISDQNGTLIEINQACCSLMSVQKKDVLGRYNIFKDNIIERNGHIPFIQSVYEKGDTINLTVDYDRSFFLDNCEKITDSLITLEICIFPITDDTGIVRNAVFQYRDVTKKRELENELNQSISEWKITFNATKDCIWLMDKNNRILRANSNTSILFGYPANKITGSHCWEIAHKSNHPIPKCPIEQVKMTLERHSEAIQMGDKWYEIIVDPVIDANGKYNGAVHVVTEITDRKVAEEALRVSERKLATLISNLPGLVYRCKNDPDWTMEFISDGCRPLTGYKPEELINNNRLSFSSLIHPDDRQRVWDMIQEAEKKDGVFQLMYRIVTSKNHVKWVWEQGQFIYGPDKEIESIEGFITDITEKKLAVEEREHLQTQLFHAQKMESIGRMAGGVAHDYNNMLSVILGCTELAMLETDKNHPLQKRLMDILNATMRSADITRQLLAFARKQPASPMILNLNNATGTLLKMLRRLIGEKIELEWLPDTDLWSVKMDPTQVDQILANLCLNARDAIKEKGKIIIKTENSLVTDKFCETHPECKPGQYILLSVNDNGSGMEQTTIENIFEPFFTTKKQGEGTGLGLSTVYGIVKQNNGFIYVDSVFGVGSTFSIYLPRHLSRPDNVEEKKIDEIPKGNNETILLVEDDPTVLEISRFMLEKSGYQVITAERSKEALQILNSRNEKIAMLITDVIMPDMNGNELASEARKRFPNIKILYMSGYTTNEIVSNIGNPKEGINFIQKPFTLITIANKVSQIFTSN